MIEKTEWKPLPDFLTISKSQIDGLGLFTLKDLDKGIDLGISHIYNTKFQDGYIRLSIGAFINHHEMPNCKAIISENDNEVGNLRHIRIITINKIKKGEELTIKYIINKLKNPKWERDFEITQ
mgnify:FL=1|tara:strand:- start:161 stop:529 length:369 start_codon:yes stop_codon:yes gene_type:complete